MRKIRLAVVGIFLLSLIAFIIFNIVNKVTTDSTPPVITSESDTVTVSVAAEDSELLAGVTAKDAEDGDLTDKVMISSMSNFTEPGKRTVSYVVFDDSNNDEKSGIYRLYCASDQADPAAQVQPE